MANYRANRLVCEAADRAMQITAGSATAGTSRSSTSTATTAATGSPRAPRRSRSGGWRSGCSSSARHRDDAHETLAAALATVLEPILGDVEVANLRILTGGASRATWAFDAVTSSGRAR